VIQASALMAPAVQLMVSFLAPRALMCRAVVARVDT
jgi:hypothetical protein